MNVSVNALGKYSKAIQIKEMWSFTDQKNNDWMTIRIKQKAKRIGIGKLFPTRFVNVVLDCNADGIKYWLHLISTENNL